MKATSKDLTWALAVTAAGALALLFARRAHWSPADLDPGVEGCLTTGLVAFAMALLHPLPYRLVLTLCAPVLVGEHILLRMSAGTATSAGMIGIQLVVMGVVGLLKALSEPGLAALPHRAPGERLYRPSSSAATRSTSEV